ncbi:MAG TPA: DNA polymerase/3'-5' exonuclease PolX [Candidatus Latescibacteria bacterium]|nr:DNA polymerase/3'-5' exonuclease PolX [Candidatus Latescibacterota bacterium]
MDNQEVAYVLEEMANLMELNGENPFRIRAYYSAARAIETIEETVVELSEASSLDEVRGVGKKIAVEIEELLASGKIQRHQDLISTVPEGLVEMQGISGLGGKRLRQIYESLGIADIDALAKACVSGEVAELKGFGAKTAQNILNGIEYLQKHEGRYLTNVARFEADQLVAFLQERPEVIRIQVAGSLRRHRETTKDVDIVVSSDAPDSLGDAFASCPAVEEVISHGRTKVSVILRSGMASDLRIVSDEQFPYALHHFTGSKEHNTLMRGRAKAHGLKMNEYGLFGGEDLVPCRDESEIFKALGLAYIEPELREGLDEIERAEAGRLPDLVSMEDLFGTVHVHTNHSDGRGTIEAMALAARDAGYHYIGICDHSKAVVYANGMDEDRCRAQWEEIDAVNAELEGIRILKGIEVDIMPEGNFDFEEEFLAEFELVVASIHSVFSMTREEATERVIRAVSSPYVDILGHPTGRLLLSRDGYPLNAKAVCEAAAEAGTALELNAHPRRLDLDWRELRYAKECGAKVSINTDAHSIEGLDDMRYGVGIARKAGLAREDILNAMPVDEFLAWTEGRA